MDNNTPLINQRDILPVDYELHWYKLLSVIGRGGYGITYLALDRNLDRKVAIKEYLPMDFAHRENNDTVHPMTDGHKDLFNWGLKRFLVEARTLAKFNHPSIIKVLSVFEHNNTAYMVMDYEEGNDLATIYKERKSFSEQELLKLFVPIIKGLADVHETGFIHRDVKPSNIYVRADGSAVLLDFGSARQTLGTRTRALTSLVTAGYAPFEQYNESEEEQGAWTDIYGLGATMYYCITGKKPVDALERGSRLLKTRKDIYQPLNPADYPGYSSAFLAAIDSALNFHPEDRPQNARLWVDMLTGKLAAIPLRENHEISTKTEEPVVEEPTVIRPASAARQATNPPTGEISQPAPVKEQQPQQATQDITRVEKVEKLEQDEHINKKAEEKAAKPAVSTAEVSTNQASATSADTTPTATTNSEQQHSDVTALDLETAKRKSQQSKAKKAKISEPAVAEKKDIPAKQKLPNQQVEQLKQQLNSIANTVKQNKVISSIAASIFVVVISVAAISTSDTTDKEVIEAQQSATNEPEIQRTPAQQIEVAKQELISGLLTQARLDIAKENYFTPAEDNAVYRFNKILTLEKSHPAALEGFNQIAEVYKEKFDSSIASENWKQAEAELKLLSTLPIKIASINKLQAQLTQYEKAQKQIQNYLVKADKLTKQNRLTKPKNRSALYFYTKVLEQDPENKQAQEGVTEIVSRLSTVLEKQISANKIRSAEKTFKLIESIDSDAPILATAESKFGEIYKTRKQIRNLLASANRDFINGRVIKPQGNNALSKFRKVLKLSPSNKKALEGVELVYQYYVSKFNQYINEEKFKDAKGIVKVLRGIGYPRKRVAALSNTIEQEKLAIKNEPQIIRKILTQLEKDIEKGNTHKINKMSLFQHKKPQYISTLFEKYKNISVQIRQQSHNKRKHKAHALIKLTGTTTDESDDYEDTSQANLDIDIVVLKDEDRQWKIVW